MKKTTKIFILSILTIIFGLYISGCGKNNLRELISTKDETKEPTTNTNTQVPITQTPKVGYYIINFVNDDDSLIESLSVKEGDIPTITNNPIKESDNTYDYIFDGWDKNIVVATKDETYKATYKSTYIDYTITFKDYDDNLISTNNYHYGDTISVPSNPSREHYSFNGWSSVKDGDREDINTVTKSITYYAIYQEETEISDNTYKVTWKNYDGTVLDIDTVEYGVIPKYDGATPTKEGTAQYTYTFNGWDRYITAVTGDTTYTAQYEATVNKYTITWKNYDGTVLEIDYNVEYGQMPTYNRGTPERPATAEYTYKFIGWDKEITPVTGDIAYTAQYEATVNKYTITWKNYDGTVLEIDYNVEYGKMPEYNGVTPTKEATAEYTYKFNGWDRAVTTVTGNAVYKANYDNIPNKYKITLNNQVSGLTISGITSGNSYDYDSKVTLKASNIPSGYTVLWSRSDGVSYAGDTYTFIVPAENITITTTKTLPYLRDGNKIYFGTYPQTLVSDESLITELNTKAGDLPTSTDAKAWTDYNYYLYEEIYSYMFYQDIDYDNNGTYDYRGVYFTSLRPKFYELGVGGDKSYLADNGYLIGTTYWFSYDPIEWEILSEENGQALILAHLILDAQEYYPSVESTIFVHDSGAEVYGNNYAFSTIRRWLNENFYDTAFSDLEKTIIQTTMVNNGVYSTSNYSNAYVCANTFDKMFLLSYQEAPKKVYYDDLVGQAQGTDYAKCQGLYVNKSDTYTGNSSWWLRSPSYESGFEAYYVGTDGNIKVFGPVYYSFYGVRPACWIYL